jgi:hypothetical protein
MIKFSRGFVEERIKSLEKDVQYCLRENNSPIQYAPFPALLYCFSTIDLLGSLLEGDASKGAHTTDNSSRYMICFMKYTIEQTHLLINIFRHKLVHLAQPNPIYTDKSTGKKYAWRYFHDNSEKHLKIEEVNQGNPSTCITSTFSIKFTHEFNISIMQFMIDIKESVEQPNGYLHTLKTNPGLQTKFIKAIEQIYQD